MDTGMYPKINRLTKSVERRLQSYKTHLQGIMSNKPSPVKLKELVVSLLAQTDALTKLLIKKRNYQAI